VYSLTTTTGQGKTGTAAARASDFPLPYTDSLASSGQAGTSDDEPQYLAAQDGSFECAGKRVTLASGTLPKPPGINSWHRLSLSMSGSASTTITASVDGQQVVSATDSRAGTGTPPWESGARRARGRGVHQHLAAGSVQHLVDHALGRGRRRRPPARSLRSGGCRLPAARPRKRGWLT
jgi:hypothetical protein